MSSLLSLLLLISVVFGHLEFTAIFKGLSIEIEAHICMKMAERWMETDKKVSYLQTHQIMYINNINQKPTLQAKLNTYTHIDDNEDDDDDDNAAS